MSARLVTSVGTISVLAGHWFATCSSFSLRRAARTTASPLAAWRCASRAPMPSLAPVMTITRDMLMNFLRLVGGETLGPRGQLVRRLTWHRALTYLGTVLAPDRLVRQCVRG